MESQDQLLSLSEAAEKIGYTTGRLRQAARSNELKAIKVGKTWVVTMNAIEEWLAQEERHRLGRPRKLGA